MPYVHSDLGVPCVTQAEFWAQESRNTGREIPELMSDYYDDLANEEKLEEQRVMEDYKGNLQRLQEYYHPDYLEEVTFHPINILEMIFAKVSFGVKKSSTTFRAKVNCSDGSNRLLEYTETSYSGSYMDPPDWDCDCVEISEEI